MAVSVCLLQKVIICLVLNFVTVTSSKLNVPRVLLPIFNDFATNFTLEATEGGCYKWWVILITDNVMCDNFCL